MTVRYKLTIILVIQFEVTIMSISFDDLFELHLKTERFPLGNPEKKPLDREWELFHLLYENLPKEQKEQFIEYTNLRGTRQKQETQAAYTFGFKNAVQLIAQSLQK